MGVKNNNQRVIVGIGLVLASLMLIITSGAFDAVFWFFIAGIVPGTDYTIPATAMLIGHLTMAALIIRLAIRKDLYPGSPSLLKAQQQANIEARREIARKVALERRKEIRKKARIAAAAEQRRKYSKAHIA